MKESRPGAPSLASEATDEKPPGFLVRPGLALHGTPRRFATAVARCVPATAGGLIQYLGRGVQIYNASEALPNLVNPFWMLPLLGILKLKAKDIVGYSVLQLAVHVPLVYGLCWLFARSIPWVAPTP